MAVKTMIAENIVPLLVRGRGRGMGEKEKGRGKGSMTTEGLVADHPRLLEEGHDRGKDGKDRNDRINELDEYEYEYEYC